MPERPSVEFKEHREVLDGANLRYAPDNELGVVYLFAELAKRWRIRVDIIRSGFPDCIAYQRVRGKDTPVRIEFEYRSRNFKIHGHDPAECDWIVCWEHDWPDAPESLHIVELRREFGLGFNVWILPLGPEWEPDLKLMKRQEWSAPSQGHKNDLVLVYITGREKAIKYVYRLAERAALRLAPRDYKDGTDFRAELAPVCALKAPLFWEDLKGDRILSTAHFVRGQMQGRPNAMDYWPYLYRMIVSRNPTARTKLARFAPEKLR